MTSAINFSNIDATYPIPGQDNDSQGFRNNFNAIKSGLQIASEEITDLQDNTAKLNTDNDFGGDAVIKNAVFLNNTGQVYVPAEPVVPTALVAGTTYQIASPSGDYVQVQFQTTATLQITGLPSTGYRQMRFEITPTTSSQLVGFVSDKSGGVLYTNPPGLFPYTFTNNNVSFWDLWTPDGGQTMYVKSQGEFA